jgi:hypothetical protein
MKWRTILLLFAASGLGCAPGQQPMPTKPATQSANANAFTEHDEIVINLLAHFDFGDGTLAQMSDQEFEEMIRSDEDFKTQFDQNADDIHIIQLFREARRRAIEEAETPRPATSRSAP